MSYEIDASEWLNTDTPLSLQALRGRVVLVSIFQMLCPGCVRNSLPQAKGLSAIFSRDDLAVIGLHSVFEHHHVMTPAALKVFASEYRLTFPVAIDRPAQAGPIPSTMSQWGVSGTPTLMIFDRDGELALRHLGHLDDLRLGAFLGQLIARRPWQAMMAVDQELSANGGSVCSF
ncbi:MAG TPA: redoxin family protein [Alcaligenes sp.]|nr:redoxin family protein [Alcaligenes sp.]HRL27684.1 redoxin family protein [Alcaligenes sp.]